MQDEQESRFRRSEPDLAKKGGAGPAAGVGRIMAASVAPMLRVQVTAAQGRQPGDRSGTSKETGLHSQ